MRVNDARRLRHAGCAWALGLWMLLWASLASAQTPKLYLLETGALGEGSAGLVTDKVDSALRERLGSTPKVKLSEPFQVKAGAKPSNAALDDALKLYNSGIGLLVSEDFEGSAQAFQRSVTLFEEHLADVEDYAVLNDALLRWGVANFKAGYVEDAQSALKVWATLNPTTELKAGDYPDEVIEIVAKERRRAQKRGAGVLKVTSNPVGAEVLVDGKPVGKTPVELKDVLPGVHYLVIKNGGPFPSAQKVEVRGQKQVDELTVNLASAGPAVAQDGASFFDELKERLRKGEIDASLTPYLKELSARSGAESVAFVVVRKGGPGYLNAGFVYVAKQDLLVRVDDEPLSGDLADLTLGAHNLSQKLIAATLDPSKEKPVTGNPFLVVAEAPKDPPKDPADPKVTDPKVTDPKVTDPKKGDGSPDIVGLGGPTRKNTDVGSGDPVIGGGAGPYDPHQDPDDEDGWYESWWFWSGVGALVVGGAAGGYFLLQDSEPEQPKGFSAAVTW